MHGNRSRKISLARLCDSGASHFNLAELVIKFHATYRTIDSTMASESNKIVEDQNFMNQDDTILRSNFLHSIF